MSLSSITLGGEPAPPRIVIYGVDGVGKTTFGASAPRPVFIRTERGLTTLRVPTFPIATSYGQVIEAITTLYAGGHGFETVVIDTLDWLERLVWEHTATLLGKDHIEDVGYGKGYLKAIDQWREILRGLDALVERGMTVICLAHAGIKRFNAPDTEPYDRYEPKLHALAAELLREWADVVGYAHYEVYTERSDAGFNKKIVRGVGAGIRRLAVEERPAYRAKNRYYLPPVLPLSWDALQDAIGQAFAQPAIATEAATPEPTPDVPSVATADEENAAEAPFADAPAA